MEEELSNSQGIDENHENEAEMTAKEALIRSLGRDFSNYTYDGNFCVYLKFVHDRSEIESDIKDDTYFPDFVHQFFVDQERIFGYKQPILRLFYTAGRLKRYIKFDYEDRLTREKDGIDADDVMSYLTPVLDNLEYTQDLNQFIQEVSSKEEQEFRPPGDLLYEFQLDYRKRRHLSRAQRELLEEAGELGVKLPINNSLDENLFTNTNGHSSKNGAADNTNSSPEKNDNQEKSKPCKKRYQIFHANSETKNFKQFQARMQTLVMWFIESATMIDFEDPRWDCFMVFEKYNPSTSGDSDATPVSTEDRYYFVGYATVYRYYAYPDKTRPRVSQMLILPQYRRNGLGTTLLQSIYDYYKRQPATLDITAEDPDEEFIAMRDLLDCKNCLKLDSFQPEKLKEGWTEDMFKEAQEKLKLCRRQARKVYEILKLRVTNKSDEEEYKNYRIEIKNRLNIPNQKQRIDVDRAMKRDPKVPVPDELRPQEKVTAAKLEDNFRLLEKQYEHVVEKLNHPEVTSSV
uniref:Histone acetyltransferase type B catalytic subunit n=1 Tax=Aceria tosichella TaxID=561515 RepID=A0A6G1SNU3_9ACAR